MNSKQLKKTHKETYENFFSEYDLVISAPMPIEMTGFAARFVGETMLGFKLPLRHYIGIKTKIPLGEKVEFYYKDNSKADFKKAKLQQFYPISMNELKELGIRNEIGVLSEYNRNDPSIIMGLLCYSILTVEDRKMKENGIFKEENKEGINKLLSKIEGIYKKSESNFDSFFHHEKNNGLYILHSFIHSKNLLLLRGSTNYSIHRSEHKLNKNKINNFLLNSNIQSNSPLQKNTLQVLNKEIGEYSKTKDFKYEDELSSGLDKLENYFGLRLLKDIEDINNGIDDSGNFFRNIKLYFTKYLSLFFKENEYFVNKNKDLNTKLKKLLGHTNDKHFCVIPVGTRTQIFTDNRIILTQSDIDSINEELGTNYTLDYSSYEDGRETEGIKIEQWISEGIYSEFCDPTKKENNTEEKQKDISQKGVVFNTIDNKIYINKQKVSSKDIHSQSATIEVFQTLLKHHGQEVRNKDFETSSYTKNKNQMTSKIISPFKKLIKEKFDIDIPLTCTGRLYDFYVKLEECEIEMEIIRR